MIEDALHVEVGAGGGVAELIGFDPVDDVDDRREDHGELFGGFHGVAFRRRDEMNGQSPRGDAATHMARQSLSHCDNRRTTAGGEASGPAVMTGADDAGLLRRAEEATALAPDAQ